MSVFSEATTWQGEGLSEVFTAPRLPGNVVPVAQPGSQDGRVLEAAMGESWAEPGRLSYTTLFGPPRLWEHC